MSHTNDPFSTEADPYPPETRTEVKEVSPRPCECGRSATVSRRQLLSGMGAMALLPAVAGAAPFQIPCVQEKQQITPCRHKFCKHYAGEGDYHGRQETA